MSRFYKKSDSESDFSSEDEVQINPVTNRAHIQAVDCKKEDVDSDDDWSNVVENESSESYEEIMQLNADYFRKKVPADGDVEVKKKKKKKKKLKVMVKEAEDSGNESNREWEKVGPSVVAVEKLELFPKDAEITVKMVLDKLAELIAGHGKKGTDRKMQIELLADLREIAKEKKLGDPVDCKIIFSIIAAIFNYNQSVASSMKPEMWEKCLHHIKEVLAILLINIDTIVFGDHVADDSENFDATKPPYRIHGCMLAVVERMDEEYMMMLQACNAEENAYIERLSDETTVCQIIEDLEKYLIQHASDDELCRVFMKRIQHMYYKFDKKSCGRSAETMADPKSSMMVLDRLNKFIYTNDTTNRFWACALLSHIYHHALHDRFYEARDLMLMSHLQDCVRQYDLPTQILYNRAMVQLGLCAFRQGLIRDAHSCLVYIQSSGRARELLAQGLLPQRQQERSSEQEKKEKRRQMPYHMHINLELLECVYLVSAMLIEIPYMAADKSRKISKYFHKVLQESDRQTLVGPPESMREHVVAACKAMKNGDWKECLKFIINERMNKTVWDLFSNKEDVKQMIGLKIQEESLRAYLFGNSYIYDSFSFENLSDMFGLPVASILCIISEMIFNEQFMASIDEITSTVVMNSSKPTQLQTLSLQLCDKLGHIIDHNEMHMEQNKCYCIKLETFFQNDQFVEQLVKKLYMIKRIPVDFHFEFKRFYEFDEWAEQARGDTNVVEAGIEIETWFWTALDESESSSSSLPYNRKIYLQWLEYFWRTLLRKYFPDVAMNWHKMFQSWLLFANSRRKAGCAPIFNKEKILLVLNQQRQWNFPKGKLNLFEDNHEAACRELKEESGVVQSVYETDKQIRCQRERTLIYVIHLSTDEMELRADGNEILDVG